MKYTTRNMYFFTESSSLLPLYSFQYSNTTELGFPISKVNGWIICLHMMMDLKTECKNTGLSLLIRKKQSDNNCGPESIKNYPQEIILNE